MKQAASLRLRLTLIILGPLLVIALLVGLWQWRDARRQAADLFDKRLLITALAVAADVARSGGDALSVETRDLLSDTSGGQVYYHSYAPDGVYVTGYATPPVQPAGMATIAEKPVQYYTSTYYGRSVRALRLRNVTTVEGIAGTFTYTVWQETTVRDALLRDLTVRAFTVMAILLGSVAFVVWFGVRIGLRPLTDLEDAISRRSSDDLAPIRRTVPVEARGIVDRLNGLLGQVDDAMAAQKTFISNAAHQLRNPIAAILAMAEAVRSAPSPEATVQRADSLLHAARHARDLANKLLTLERANAGGGLLETVDLRHVTEAVTENQRPLADRRGVDLHTLIPGKPLLVRADPVMLQEALANLIDNALTHGGKGLSEISVAAAAKDGRAALTVTDDGIGIARDDERIVRARFGQAGEGEGSGLGLSIAEAVAESSGGALDLAPGEGGGLTVILRLPLAGDQRPAA